MWDVKYVPEGDIYFIQVGAGRVARTLERKPDILVDVDEDGKALAVEVVGATATPVPDLMAVLSEFGLVGEQPRLDQTPAEK